MPGEQGRTIAVVIVAIVLVVLLLALVAGAGFGMGPGMMGWWGFGYGSWWGVLMMIFMALFWALLIGGGVLLVLWLVQQGRLPSVGAGPSAARPLDILRERYAKGEITREQYEQMRRDLEE